MTEVIETIECSRKHYRAPFKIEYLEWSPCGRLMAIASRKGELMVKRAGWKRCWKLNVAEIGDLPGEACAASNVGALTWSPDGSALAVAMTDGRLLIVDVESAQVRWTSRLPPEEGSDEMPTIDRLKWFATSDATSNDSTASEADMLPKHLKSSSADCQEHATRVAAVARLLQQQHGTLLCAMRSDLSVCVYAAGLVLLRKIDFNALLDSLSLTFISWYDMSLCPVDCTLSIAATTYGAAPLANGEKGVGPEVCHTQVFRFRLDVGNRRRLWEVVCKLVRLQMQTFYVSATLSGAEKDWINESQIFANRLHPSNRVNVSYSLFNYLMNGVGGPMADRWLESDLAQNGINSMREFLDKRFTELIASLRSHLSRACTTLAMLSDSLVDDIRMLRNGERSYRQDLLPTRVRDVNVYPYDSSTSAMSMSSVTGEVDDGVDKEWQQLEAQAMRLLTTYEQMHAVCIENLRSLARVVRWMSMLSPLLKSTKRFATVINASRHCDVTALVRYMIETFVLDETQREWLLKATFDIDSIIREMKEKETAETEDMYMERRTHVDCVLAGDPPTCRCYNALPDGGRRSDSPPALDKVQYHWKNEELPLEAQMQATNMLLDDNNSTLTTCNVSMKTVVEDTLTLSRRCARIICRVISRADSVCQVASDATHQGYGAFQLHSTGDRSTLAVYSSGASLETRIFSAAGECRSGVSLDLPTASPISATISSLHLTAGRIAFVGQFKEESGEYLHIVHANEKDHKWRVQKTYVSIDGKYSASGTKAGAFLLNDGRVCIVD